MTIIEALKTGLPLRLKGHTFSYSGTFPYGGYVSYINPDSWVDPEYLLSVVYLTKEEILSNKWQVKVSRAGRGDRGKRVRRGSPKIGESPKPSSFKRRA